MFKQKMEENLFQINFCIMKKNFIKNGVALIKD